MGERPYTRLMVPFMDRFYYDRQKLKDRAIAFAMADAKRKADAKWKAGMMKKLEDPKWERENSHRSMVP